ncbi:PQQ-dependent sugar dehydrogenase [Niastella sp. OAS944]|uniref:CBM96 family carbohydrate-binding protein n=1 Tax=Niastella sp. OAS944 TaxID=2664089 RepID=UPI00349161EF|nr:glucose/arabinose dehydrogenase [Chitinophagaceae bacterium OAS944]
MKKTNILKAWRVLINLCIILFVLQLYVQAQTLPANFQRVQVTASLSNPTAMAFTPDGRVLICQQSGQLRVVKNGSLLSTPAVSLSVNTSGERGLIGVAVDPNFTTNQYIYLYYTHTSGPHNRVSRFTMTGDVAGSETAILDLPTLNAIYHNGGGLAFGNDGKLYVAVGENQVGSNSQNLDSYLGKLLRINPDGTVPTGNPFTGGAARSRVWAYGLRNPFTISVDPVSGKILVNDVGNATWEEINDATTGGRNFGWPDKEGMCTSGCTGFTNPIYVYATNRNDPPPAGQGCAINGGTFFNGAISNYPATYNGRYFFLDYCGNWIDHINPTVASPTRSNFGTSLGSGLVYIKQGTDGNLYYLSRDNNALYRIIYTGTQAPVITTQPQSITISQGNTATFSVTATGNPAPTYQWRKGGTNISGATSATYSITNVQPAHAGTYSVVVTNSSGSVTSNNATLTVTQPNTAPVATITSPANGTSFRAGTVINFTGTATDAEDGTLPAANYEWWVDFHHANHIHPGPDISDGANGGSFPISAEGHTETDIWYRLYLVVRDAQGARDTTYVEIFPVLSTLNLRSEPAGLQIRLDDVPFATPYTTPALSGMIRPMEAISPQTVNGTTYLFDHWAHGGTATQNITITDNEATYTAHFRVAPPAITFTPVHDAYVRDGTNAGITHGTTDSTLLITKLSPTGQLNNARESYLMFDLTSLTGNVSSVQLKVYGKVDLTTVPSVPVGVFSVANTTWTENTLTWNNKPVTSVSALASKTVTNAAATYYTWDVTNYVRAELAAGRKKLAFAMKSELAHDPRIFWNSAEFGSNPPLLSVITDSTTTPTCEPVTASGNDGNVPANVLDNDLNTRWSANGDGQWIQFCLANSTTVSGVQIAFYSGNTRASTFDVLTGTDGLNWTTAASGLVSSGTSLNLETFTFTPRTAKYVRIVGHGNSVNAWNSYTEVKIQTSTGSQTITLAPTQDAYVRDGASATITHGTTDSTLLITKVNPTTTTGNNRETYLLFNTGSVTSVSAATLRVYGIVDLTTVPGVPVGVFPVANTTWTENTLTWNNKPASGTTALATATVTNTAYSYITWDITSYVQSELQAGRTNISLALKSLTGHDPRIFWKSAEAGSNPPQLVITTNTMLARTMTVATVPTVTRLKTTLASYPNPFRESSTITFTLPAAGHTQLAAFDITGKQVAVLVNAYLQAGDHRSLLTTHQLPAGIYVLKLVHSGNIITTKLVKE